MEEILCILEIKEKVLGSKRVQSLDKKHMVEKTVLLVLLCDTLHLDELRLTLEL